MNSITTSPAHTAGPWRIDSLGDDRIWILDDQSNYIGEITTEDECGFVCSKVQQRANARLIAAAPDLLTEAKRYSSDCGSRICILEQDFSEDPSGDIQDQIAHWQATKAGVDKVIAKAEGR